MSRFFRSADSISSSDSESEEEAEPEKGDNTEGLSKVDTLKPPESVRTSLVDRASADWTNHHRDFLLHALLEDRCMKEVLSSYASTQPGRRPSRDLPQVQAEANARYQRLCARLASYNLISSGLEGDQHSVTRQRYRDGLDVLSQQRSATVVPQSIQRLLTDGDADDVEHVEHQNVNFGMDRIHALPQRTAVPPTFRRLLTGPAHSEEHDTMHLARAFTNTLSQRSLSPSTATLRSRYHDDFEELNMLGRGGYGIVYHVRHRLDNQMYAVKKVPISNARLHRIQKRGEVEVQEVLRELRTLASLDHPNVVRYFNGWIEWVDSVAPPALAHVHSDTRSPIFSEDSDHVQSGAEDSRVETLDRVVTEDSLEDAGIVFEASSSTSTRTELETSIVSIGSAANGDYRLRRVGTRSTIATVRDDTVESVERHREPSMSLQSVASGVHFTEPTLALHMQMAMYPMSLADFLSPPSTTPNSHMAVPLVHCFHLEPSISILLSILHGLEYLHTQDIVHRDIKPANIFLGPQPVVHSGSGSVDLMSCTDCHSLNTANPIRLEVRIGDFGLVTVADPNANASPAADAVGTAIYRPPTATARHPSLDIYALGVVAFELLCKFDTRMERLHTLQQLKQGEFPPDLGRDWGPRVGEAMKECIATMLALDGNAVSIPELKQKLTAILSMREQAALS